jgi:hypothetical protein
MDAYTNLRTRREEVNMKTMTLWTTKIDSLSPTTTACRVGWDSGRQLPSVPSPSR